MKKCIVCGDTKNLKNVWAEEDDGKINPNKSACKNCYFNEGFELDPKSPVTEENWYQYDYNWKKRKRLN